MTAPNKANKTINATKKILLFYNSKVRQANTECLPKGNDLKFNGHVNGFCPQYFFLCNRISIWVL